MVNDRMKKTVNQGNGDIEVSNHGRLKPPAIFSGEGDPWT
jgi:hypothetical protein